MISIITTNTKNGSTKEYTVEPFTTLRTRMTPYPNEAFDTEVGTTIVGSEMGTLVCKHKTSEVFYRNEELGIEALLANMTCKRVIA